MAETECVAMERDKQAIIDSTRRWISSVVIGLNLCPFAQRVFGGGLIRYVASDAVDETALSLDLATELRKLAQTPITTIETTLLLHPHVLTDFLDYNDFLDVADRLLEDLELSGVIQIASFHPAYQFAGTKADAVENYTNRSPYPMLHLLREESVSNVAADPAEMAQIPARNVATLRRLGRKGMLKLLKAAQAPGDPGPRT